VVQVLTFIQGTGPSFGTLTNFNPATGTVTYTPQAGFTGTDTFTFTVRDDALAGSPANLTSQPGIVTIQVLPVNAPPVAHPQSVTTAEDSPLAITLTGDDGDPEVVQVLTFAITTPPQHGTITSFDPATGAVTYTPHADYNGSDSFAFTVTDDDTAGLPANLTSPPAVVSIVVTPVNKPPVADPQSVTMAEGAARVIQLTGADGDPEVVQVLTFAITTPPQHGTLSGFNPATGAVTYTPFANYNGPDSFAFTVIDDAAAGLPANLTSPSATVSISVTPVNARPLADAQSVATVEDAPVAIALTGADGDPEVDQILTFMITTPPQFGTLIDFDEFAGTVTYVPNANFNGSDSFAFTVTDDDQAGLPHFRTSLPATVSISVAPVNKQPVAHPQLVATAENTAATITLSADDGDPEVVQALIFTITAPPQHGTLGAFDPVTRQITYTPNADYNGPDSFAFTVTDDHTAGAPANLTSAPATVTLSVTAVNAQPLAHAQNAATAEDLPVSITLTGEDGDPEVNQVLTFAIVTPPQHGTITGFNPATGAVTYAPNADYNGTDSFAFTVTDDDQAGLPHNQTSAPATVSIAIAPVNKPPLAIPQSVTTAEDASKAITLIGDDGDPEVVQQLTFAIAVHPQHGVLTGFDPQTGAVTYTPNPDYHGPDSFSFTVTDDALAGAPAFLTSGPATVSITVTAVNKRPVALPQNVSLAEDTWLAITLTGDDGDPEVAQVMTFAITVDPQHGTLSGFNPATGEVVYTPNDDYHGSDSFVFTVTDDASAGLPANLTSQPATVTITVTPVNDAPVAADNAYSVLKNNPLFVIAPGVLTNDFDVDGDPLTAELDQGPTNGTLTLNADGSFTYHPGDGFAGSDFFTYQARDGSELSNMATVTITVIDTNDPPLAVNDSYTMAEDAALTVSAPGVLGNDTDPDNNPLTASLVDPPVTGILTFNANGSFTYAPPADFHGTVMFTYRAHDGSEFSNDATVTINITPVNDPPVAHPQSVATDEDTPLTITLTGEDGDPEVIQTLTFAIVTPPQHGTLGAFNPLTGAVTYTPNQDYFGPDSFVFTVTDDAAAGAPANLTSSPATVSITVTAVNDPPVAANDGYSTSEGAALNVAAPGVLENDADVDGDPLTAELISPPSHGTLTLNPDGSFVYTPADYFNGTDQFTYQARDGQLDSNVATVTITVAAVNDPPVLVDNTGTTNRNEPMTFMAEQLLGNALPGPVAPPGTADDESGQTLSVIAVGPDSAQGGTAELDTNTGLITYTPPLNFVGTDTLTYRVVDNGVPSAQAIGTLTVTVVAVNDPPTGSVVVGTTHNMPLTFSLEMLLNNGMPAGEGESGGTAGDWSVTFGTPSHGRVKFDGTSVTYTPEVAFVGEDSFTYTLHNGDPSSALRGTVMVQIQAGPGPLYQNPLNPFDVNGDGNLGPIDVLTLINYINQHGSGPIPTETSVTVFLDVIGDGNVTPQGVIRVINELNRRAQDAPGGEGEAVGSVVNGPSSVVSSQLSVVSGQWPVVGSPLSLVSGQSAADGDLAKDAQRTSSLAESIATDESANPRASLYEDPADLWDLEDALSDIAADLDSAGQLEAADRLFATL
jgi:large repetitive protein